MCLKFNDYAGMLEMTPWLSHPFVYKIKNMPVLNVTHDLHCFH